MRSAQDPTIPISECSACALPSFIAAASGTPVMKNIYVLGSMQDWLTAAQQGTSAQEKATAAGLRQYIAGLEINWAITQAGTVSDETKIMGKLQHLDINTLGILWTRTPANYESYSQVLAAMEIINPDGSATLFK